MLIYLSLKRLKERSKKVQHHCRGFAEITVDLQMDNIQGAEEDFRVGRGGGVAKTRVINTGKEKGIKE